MPNPDPVAAFLRHIRERVPDGDKRRIAELAGLSNGTFTRWLDGKREPNPKLKTLQALADVFKMSVLELLSDPATSGAEPVVREGPAKYAPGRFLYIPRLPVILAAGATRLDVDAEATEPYAFREDFFGPHGLDPDRCRVAPLAKDHHGESMRETIQPGAMLLLDCRPVMSIIKDALYVVRAPDDEGVTVKRCAIRDEQLVCKPDNPTHQPFAIPLRGRQVQKIVLARVVWWANEAV